MTTQRTTFPPTREGWLAALRSGEFAQHRGTFILSGGEPAINAQTAEAFCCIAVAAHILGSEASYTTAFTSTPEWRAFWPGDEAPLFAANDRLDWTFPEIADYVEFGKQPDGKLPLSTETPE